MIAAAAKILYEEQGFLVIPTGLPEETLDAAREGTGPLQPEGYHYSDGPRIFEAWKGSQAVRDLAYATPIVSLLHDLYGARPRPFQTINFRKGTNQPLHQDGIHFQTKPLGRMAGAWVALEDMDERNGPLCYVPGSHRLGFLGWQDLGFSRSAPGEQFEQYRRYEEEIARRGAALGGPVPLVCRKGDAFVWGLDLLHGGWPIEDETRTRHSCVVHYHLDDADFGYAPMFSDPGAGEFHRKSMRWFDRSGQQHPYERNRVKVMTSYGS